MINDGALCRWVLMLCILEYILVISMDLDDVLIQFPMVNHKDTIIGLSKKFLRFCTKFSF